MNWYNSVQEQVADSREYGNESSGSVKFWKNSWLAEQLAVYPEGLSSLELLS
jgi:hypothetical protein